MTANGPMSTLTSDSSLFSSFLVKSESNSTVLDNSHKYKSLKHNTSVLQSTPTIPLTQGKKILFYTKSNVESMNNIAIEGDDHVSVVSSITDSDTDNNNSHSISKCSDVIGVTNLSSNNITSDLRDDHSVKSDSTNTVIDTRKRNAKTSRSITANCKTNGKPLLNNNNSSHTTAISLSNTCSFNPIDNPIDSCNSHTIKHPCVGKITAPAISKLPFTFQHPPSTSSVALTANNDDPSGHQSPNCSSIHPTSDLLNNINNNFSETESTLCLIDEISEMDSVSCVGINPKSVDGSNSSKNRHLNYTNHDTLSSKIQSTGIASNFRKRSSSIGSDCTDFLMGDVEQMVQNIASQHETLKEYSSSMINLASLSGHRDIDHQQQKKTAPPPQQTHANLTPLSNLDKGG